MLETFPPSRAALVRRRFGSRQSPRRSAGPGSRRGGTCSARRRRRAPGRRSPRSCSPSTGRRTATPSPGGSGRRRWSTSRRSAPSGTTSRRTCAPLARPTPRGRRGSPPPDLRVAVRSGDTPSSRRRSDGARAAPRPRHDPRVAPPAHRRARARGPPLGRDGDRGRDPRRRARQARRPPRALARAARGARAPAAAAHRALRHGEPHRGDGWFLVGTERVDRCGHARCTVVETGRRRAFDLGIEIPKDEALLRSRRTTCGARPTTASPGGSTAPLVFVNTRRIAERATRAGRAARRLRRSHHARSPRARRLRARSGSRPVAPGGGRDGVAPGLASTSGTSTSWLKLRLARRAPRHAPARRPLRPREAGCRAGGSSR